MSYDAVVDWSSLTALVLFLGMALIILYRTFRPGRAKEMERMARLPLDAE